MLRRPIASALLLWCLAACTTWHVEKGVSPLLLISTEYPSAVRLTRADSSQIVLHQPRIAVGDSLAGLHNGAPSSVAVSDVTQIAIRRFSTRKTLGLILAIQAVALVVGVATCPAVFDISKPGCK